MPSALDHFKDLAVSRLNPDDTTKQDVLIGEFDEEVCAIFDKSSEQDTIDKSLSKTNRAGAKGTLVLQKHADKLGVQEYGRFGCIVGESKAREVVLNVHEPFCAITVGVQGSGKSHTMGCIIENCAIPAAGMVNLR